MRFVQLVYIVILVNIMQLINDIYSFIALFSSKFCEIWRIKKQVLSLCFSISPSLLPFSRFSLPLCPSLPLSQTHFLSFSHIPSSLSFSLFPSLFFPLIHFLFFYLSFIHTHIHSFKVSHSRILFPHILECQRKKISQWIVYLSFMFHLNFPYTLSLSTCSYR